MAIFGICVKLPECNPTWAILVVAALPVESPSFQVSGCRETVASSETNPPEDPWDWYI